MLRVDPFNIYIITTFNNKDNIKESFMNNLVFTKNKQVNSA